MGRAISQTKNYALSGGGDPAEKLELVDKEEPVPGSTPPGYVLVRLKLRAINPTDLTTVRIDRFSRLSGSSEIIVGSEGTGVVKEVGEGVTQFSVGQRVTPIIFLRYLKDAQGSWQEYICVKAAHVFPIPDSVTDEVAAQLVVNSCIALGLLKEVQVPIGEFLLQTGAASVIGRQIIQLAKHFGIITINIVRRDAAKAELEALGGNVVINSTKEDVLQIVKDVTNGKLAYAAFDAVVDENTKILASSVRNEGRLVIWGALASWDVRIGLLDLMRKVRVGCWILYDEVPTEEKLKKLGDEVLELLEQKVVEPLVGETFDLADYKKALKATERPARGGKVYLKG